MDDTVIIQTFPENFPEFDGENQNVVEHIPIQQLTINNINAFNAFSEAPWRVSGSVVQDWTELDY